MKRVNISIWTILHCHKVLGWTFHGSAYCQLIRITDKQKRLEWASRYWDESEVGFNVIWSHESLVRLESHKRYCCRKKACHLKIYMLHVCSLFCRATQYTSNITKLEASHITHIVIENAKNNGKEITCYMFAASSAEQTNLHVTSQN